MEITRKQFLGAALGSGAGLLLPACGGGGYGGSSGTPSSSCGATIADNHGHTLTIAVADLNATADKVYDISGAASHAHAVTLTLAQLAALKAGTALNVTSSPAATDGHTHAISASCIIY